MLDDMGNGILQKVQGKCWPFLRVWSDVHSTFWAEDKPVLTHQFNPEEQIITMVHDLT